MAEYRLVRFVVVLAALGLAAGSSLADNIVLNSDMEEGPDATTGFPTTFGAWNGISTAGAYIKDAAAAHSGENYAYSYRDGARIWQCVTDVVAGKEYTLSAWVLPNKMSGVGWDAGEGVKFDVLWYSTETASYGDPGALRWDTAMIFYAPEESGYGVWTQISGALAAAPATAQCAVLRIGARLNGTNKSWVGFDDITMTPEPATMCLLTLGGLAFLRKRK